MADRPIQDTIDFTTTADITIVNDTVRMQAAISAIITDGNTEESLRADIRAAIKSFINTDEWQFSNTARALDPSGFERLSTVVTARVSETENYNLDERCKKASRKGLTISTPSVDTSIPQAKLDKAEQDLRMMIIKNVSAECNTISEATGRPYRVGRLNFASGSNNFSNARGMVMIASSGVTKTTYGSDGIGNDDETLGNASKLTMSASVSLAVDSTSTGTSPDNVEHLVQPAEAV